MARKKPAGRGRRSFTEIDQRVATNIRRIRVERGMTQEGLAGELGISFQQLQKYETGKNRVTIGRLITICEALEVSLSEIIR